MAKIKMQKQTVTPDVPPSGFVTIYPEGSSIKYINENGVVTTLASGITREEVEDILANSFNNTSSITWTYDDSNNYFEASLETSLLSKLNDIEIGATADQTASEIKTAYESNSDTNALTDANLTKLTEIFSNRYPVSIKSTSDTLNLLNESMVLYAGQTGAVTLTIPTSSTFSNDGHAREFGIFNYGTFPLTVQLSGTDIFANGTNKFILNTGNLLRFIGAYPTLSPPAIWVIANRTPAITQVRRDAIWSASNFITATAVPFDTTDIQVDSSRIERNLSNTTRVDVKTTGNHIINFSGAIDSTGGSSYKVSFWLRVNGTTIVPGSVGSVGNYQTEDSYFGKTIYYKFNVNDYVELIFDQTSTLTGNANNIILAISQV